MPSGKSASKMGKRGKTSREQSPRGGPVLLNKLLPKGIKQNIFRKNKCPSQISPQDPKEPSLAATTLLPHVSDSDSPAGSTKNNQKNGSSNSLNQLRSSSLTSYQSSGYGSLPHSARASLQEQHLPLIGGGAQGLCEGEVECRRKTSVECGRKVSFEGGRKISQEGGRKISQEGGRKVSQEGGRKVSQEGGRKISQEGGRKISQEGGRKSSVQSEMESSPVVLKRNGTRLSREEGEGTAKHLPLIGGGAQGLCEGEFECRRKTSVECGRKVSFEGGRKVSQEGGRKVSQDGGRKSSVQSEMESSPVVLKRNGTRLSREEGGGTAKILRSPVPRTKHRSSLGQSSPRTSQALYQSPMTITSFARKESQAYANKQQLESSHPVLNIVVNSRRYQVSPNGNVREGSPTFVKMRRTSMAHRMSLQPRKPSLVVLPPIAAMTGSNTSHAAAANRHSVPTKPNSWVFQPRRISSVEQRGEESSRVHPHPAERKPSGENPVATVIHRVPLPTPVLIAENQHVTDSRDDPDRPKSRRKNAVVSAEDKPDVNALLLELAIPQINLISPTPIPSSSQPPSLSQSACTSPDN